MSGPLAALSSIDWSRPQEELDRIKGNVEAWTKSKPPYVEVGLATLGGSTQGAVLGGVMGAMTRLDPDGAGKLLTPPTGGGNDPVRQYNLPEDITLRCMSCVLQLSECCCAWTAAAVLHAQL